MLADLLVDVNGRAFSLVKVGDVSQLPITLRAERRSDGFYAVRDDVFMAWVWNILLTSEPVGWTVASVLGIWQAWIFWSEPDRRLVVGDATVRCRCCVANLRGAG